ncbi:MAG TPA: methyltransferase domain-containing protein [Ktedonobacterales bacterium]|nr:methyltransferase domain-containing protein [Ktedonobacterales bacterium]
MCPICGNSQGNQQYAAREMMFGFRDQFTYIQCARCGVLFLSDPPADLGKYYPDSYYSLSSSPAEAFHNPIKNLVKRLQTNYAVTQHGALGRVATERFPMAHTHVESLAGLGLTHQSRILDVGCGSGFLVYALKNAGFQAVAGIDPYIKEDIRYPNGLSIRKQSIHEATGVWDVIMFHHAFEHIADPHETMQQVARLLAPAGVCLIRIPISASYAWQHYGPNWVQLDAPRHFFLHTPTSMRLLAQEAGLRMENIIYDSTSFQFWGSELYSRDISLWVGQRMVDEIKAGVAPAPTANAATDSPQPALFTRDDLARFEAQAQKLNEQQLGDQAGFYMRKPA